MPFLPGGLHIIMRTSMKDAVIAGSRELAVILHRRWIDSTEFISAKGAAVTNKRVLIGTIAA
jgi:hypothetical protein